MKKYTFIALHTDYDSQWLPRLYDNDSFWKHVSYQVTIKIFIYSVTKMNNINAFYIQSIVKSWRPLYTEWNTHFISKFIIWEKDKSWLFGHYLFLVFWSYGLFISPRVSWSLSNLNLCLCASESCVLCIYCFIIWTTLEVIGLWNTLDFWQICRELRQLQIWWQKNHHCSHGLFFMSYILKQHRQFSCHFKNPFSANILWKSLGNIVHEYVDSLCNGSTAAQWNRRISSPRRTWAG